jgi:hypothetical protein
MTPRILRPISAIAATVTLAIGIAACDKQKTAPSGPAPVSIQIQGTAPAVGAASQFTAIAIAADGTQTIVTNQASWQSSNTAIVTVSNGMVHGVAPGNAAVSATYLGVSGSMNLAISTVGCAFDVQPTQADIPGDGGSVTITVTQQQGANCPWTAVTNSFLSFTGPTSGTGTGSAVVTAAFNPTSARVGTVTIAGATVTVNQSRGRCVNSVSPSTESASDTGGSFLLRVDAPTGCTWAIETTATWITVDRRVQTGTQDVVYQVAANPSTNMRQATLTIDRFTIVVTQSGPVPGPVFF